MKKQHAAPFAAAVRRARNARPRSDQRFEDDRSDGKDAGLSHHHPEGLALEQKQKTRSRRSAPSTCSASRDGWNRGRVEDEEHDQRISAASSERSSTSAHALRSVERRRVPWHRGVCRTASTIRCFSGRIRPTGAALRGPVRFGRAANNQRAVALLPGGSAPAARRCADQPVGGAASASSVRMKPSDLDPPRPASSPTLRLHEPQTILV